eukprot:m.155013 g.155013  ORF g.155013 m.155013 type:complete len:117 (-) comp30919_c2_seq5:2090-2440(-)
MAKRPTCGTTTKHSCGRFSVSQSNLQPFIEPASSPLDQSPNLSELPTDTGRVSIPLILSDVRWYNAQLSELPRSTRVDVLREPNNIPTTHEVNQTTPLDRNTTNHHPRPTPHQYHQ